jgi:hypothetical protein
MKYMRNTYILVGKNLLEIQEGSRIMTVKWVLKTMVFEYRK